MLTTLPKLADRGFVLGFFLPSLLFGVALLVLFSDAAVVAAMLDGLMGKDLGSAALFLVAVWLLSVLVLMLNHPSYRFLEGYMWPLSKFTRGKRRNQARLEKAQKELRRRFERLQDGKGSAEDLWRYSWLKSELAMKFPTDARDVMSTRFGNAIKAFEMYPNDIYGADGVPMWLRLVTVLPKEFLAQIQDARNQIDFLINAGMFGAMFSAVALVAGLRRTNWVELASGRDASDMIAKLAWPQICAAIAAALVSWGFYRWAVTRVPAWGELVMAAFDCYLPALAVRLGYELPRESEKQREFWVTYGQMVVYRRDPEGDLPFNAALWTRAGVPPVAVSNQRESEKEEEDRGDKEDKDP